MKPIALILLAAFACNADDALDSAVKTKLQNCGIHLAMSYGLDPYGKINASIGVISLSDTKAEETRTKSVLSWARDINDARIRSAYVSILETHLSNITEAIHELTTHEFSREMEKFKKDQVADKARAAALMVSLPDPCHSSSQKGIK